MTILERPTKRRQAEFLAAVKRSRKLHRPWLDAPKTPDEFRKYIRRFETETHISYWVCTELDKLAGVINISEIVQGNFRSGYLGYYALAPHHGKGYMTQGLRMVISHAFWKIKLHRLEANIQPGNEPSRMLVQRLGFRCEGLSPRYLKIGGRWKDHERWAVTVEEWT